MTTPDSENKSLERIEDCPKLAAAFERVDQLCADLCEDPAVVEEAYTQLMTICVEQLSTPGSGATSDFAILVSTRLSNMGYKGTLGVLMRRPFLAPAVDLQRELARRYGASRGVDITPGDDPIAVGMKVAAKELQASIVLPNPDPSEGEN